MLEAEGDGKRPLPETPAFMKTNERANMSEQNGSPITSEQNGTTSANKIIKNETARRIAIKSKADDSPLIIPPFGSRTLEQAFLDGYDYADWEKHHLITREDPPTKPNESPLAGFGCLLFILFFVVGALFAIFLSYEYRWHIYGAIVFLLGVLTLFVMVKDTTKGMNRIKGIQTGKESKKPQSLNWKELLILFSILSVSVGLPAFIIYAFGGGKELLIPGKAADPALLGRGLQLGFIAIAATLPALMYFLFGRQQLDKVRDDFIREVMLLDPNVITTTEAWTKYGPLFDSVYGSGNAPLAFLPILICTTLMTMGWLLTLLPVGQAIILEGNNLLTLFAPYPAPLNYGFLGAYFFAINMVFRGYVRADLTAKTYTHINVRLLVTIVLVWVVGSLPVSQGDGSQNTILLLAFLIGIVPETATTLIQGYFNSLRHLRILDKQIRLIEGDHPLTNLEGVTLYDRARLLEEGIENVENLAHHNLIELMVRTRIPTQRLLDLFDQAILYLHLGTEAEQIKESLQKLRGYGIRTATNMLNVYGIRAVSDLSRPEKIEGLNMILEAERTDGQANDGPGHRRPDTPPKKYEVIVCALHNAEWIDFLVHWHSTSSERETVYAIETFYQEKTG